MSEGFVCSICGQVHDGLPTDFAYSLPDDVWAIPPDEREEKAKFDRDLCKYGDRYFIRCVLRVPFTEGPGSFNWGVWVEVAAPVFQRYLILFETDASSEPRHTGRLANALPDYSDTLNAKVEIQFRESTERPDVYLVADDPSSLANEQRNGINDLRYHEILESRFNT
jgi:hypothetical protein